MFEGTYVAVVTPFKDGKVDADAFQKIIENLITNGVDGIVPCGTTGESATLSHEEHVEVVSLAKKFAAGRAKILAGAGSNSTEEALELSQKIADIDVDGLLIITPYYNKPTQEGLYQHFKKVAESVKVPICVYSVPGRTGVEIEVDTLKRLEDDFENIVAIKEATGDLDFTCDVLSDTSLSVLSGNDNLAFPMMTLGGSGVVSVAGNIIPAKVSSMINLCLDREFSKAREIHFECLNLFRKLFLETNPIPVKTAVHLMGMASLEMRLPLCQMTEKNLEIFKRTLKKYNLI